MMLLVCKDYLLIIFKTYFSVVCGNKLNLGLQNRTVKAHAATRDNSSLTSCHLENNIFSFQILSIKVFTFSQNSGLSCKDFAQIYSWTLSSFMVHPLFLCLLSLIFWNGREVVLGMVSFWQVFTTCT